MIKLFVFDFDGTIVDTKELYLEAVYKFLNKHGYKVSKNIVEKNLGPKMQVALKNLLKNLNAKKIEKMRNEINHYVESRTKEVKPCPNIHVIKKLRRKALITNSTRNFVLPILKRFALKFDAVFSAEDFSDKIEGIRRLMKKFNVKPCETIYIADRKEDVKIAKAVGCNILIVLLKSWDKDKFRKKSKFVINDFSELENYLNNLIKR